MSCGVVCVKVGPGRDYYSPDDAYGIRPDKVELYGQRRPGGFAGQAGTAAGGEGASGMGRGTTVAILISIVLIVLILFVAVAAIALLVIQRMRLFTRLHLRL